MNEDEYELIPLDHPEFIESQKRWQAVFEELSDERTAWENWKPIRDIQ